VAEEPAPGTLRPTSFALLGGAVGVGAALGWFGGQWLERAEGVVPTVPWTSLGVLVFAAAALGAIAWSTWRTIHRQRRWLEPRQALNRVLLAKASALAGAVMAGGYVGFGALFLDDLSAPLPQERVLRSALVAGAAVLVVVAALLLERACRVPGSPGEDAEDDADTQGPAR
jgi:membrane protein DedA with SNARE-associated domain